MLFTLEGRLGIGQRGLVLLELSLGDRKGRLVLVDDRLIRAGIDLGADLALFSRACCSRSRPVFSAPSFTTEIAPSARGIHGSSVSGMLASRVISWCRSAASMATPAWGRALDRWGSDD